MESNKEKKESIAFKCLLMGIETNLTFYFYFTKFFSRLATWKLSFCINFIYCYEKSDPQEFRFFFFNTSGLTRILIADFHFVSKHINGRE